MREEYKAITDAGLIVQIDEPEFSTSWMFYPDWSVAEYRKYLEFCVEIINHALDGLPEDQVRFHVCWGSGHRPHTNDIELKYIADLLLKINAQSYCDRSRQRAPRARVAGLEGRQAAGRQDPDARRHQPRHRPGRAPGAGGRATGQLRQRGGQGERADRAPTAGSARASATRRSSGPSSQAMSEGARRASDVLWGR